jgi:cobalt-zinc-cadmium efflux system protein
MAHIRKPLAAAVVVNTAICVAEAVASWRADSISLLMDAVHNVSDELALVCLLLAFIFVASLSQKLQRFANLLNSVGLLVLSAVILWQAIQRLIHPRPLVGLLPIAVGLGAAVGNWAVARFLRPWQAHNAAIRLAYVHNLGDTYVSLLPALAGVVVFVSGRSFFDPIVAILIAAWIVWSTVIEIQQSRDALLWPSNATCPHNERTTAT